MVRRERKVYWIPYNEWKIDKRDKNWSWNSGRKSLDFDDIRLSFFLLLGKMKSYYIIQIIEGNSRARFCDVVCQDSFLTYTYDFIHGNYNQL